MVTKEYFGEGKNIEFKRQMPGNHEKFLKDIIAFANSSGGKVILGIEDETNIVYGIGDQSPFKLSDTISTMVSDACTPQINPDITIKTIDEKTVLEIEVVPGKFRPYYLANKGKETTTYIRINGTSRPADERKLKELELEGQRISYDSMQDIGKDYDEEKALSLCKKMKQVAIDACTTDEQKAEIKDITIEKLEDFGVLYREGKNLFPTHAFNLLTDNKNRFAKIQCGLFKGITRDVFIDQKVFDGPIYEQVEDAYQFVLRHINLGANIDGVYRNDSYELPIKAVREMIANAVVHRSYLEDACVQVSIYDDRIEVSSPGMLYGGLDIETAKFGKSSCRNAAIAAAFHYMHIVEAWGTGIPRIISNCKDYGLQEPLFEEFGNGFRVVMYRKGVFDLQMFADSKEKVVNDPEKVVNDPKKVVNDPEKVVNAFEKYVILLEEAGITAIFTKNIEKVYNNCANAEIFSQANIVEWLTCSSTKASNIIAAMKKAKIIRKVEGLGPGKYRFIQL